MTAARSVGGAQQAIVSPGPDHLDAAGQHLVSGETVGVCRRRP
jgi:hypothetical protein